MIKLEVTTHSGDLDIIEVEEFDPEKLNDLRNNNEIEAILIGENSYSRIDLKNVKVIEK